MTILFLQNIFIAFACLLLICTTVGVLIYALVLYLMSLYGKSIIKDQDLSNDKLPLEKTVYNSTQRKLLRLLAGLFSASAGLMCAVSLLEIRYIVINKPVDYYTSANLSAALSYSCFATAVCLIGFIAVAAFFNHIYSKYSIIEKDAEKIERVQIHPDKRNTKLRESHMEGHLTKASRTINMNSSEIEMKKGKEKKLPLPKNSFLDALTQTPNDPLNDPDFDKDKGKEAKPSDSDGKDSTNSNNKNN